MAISHDLKNMAEREKLEAPGYIEPEDLLLTPRIANLPSDIGERIYSLGIPFLLRIFRLRKNKLIALESWLYERHLY